MKHPLFAKKRIKNTSLSLLQLLLLVTLPAVGAVTDDKLDYNFSRLIKHSPLSADATHWLRINGLRTCEIRMHHKINYPETGRDESKTSLTSNKQFDDGLVYFLQLHVQQCIARALRSPVARHVDRALNTSPRKVLFESLSRCKKVANHFFRQSNI